MPVISLSFNPDNETRGRTEAIRMVMDSQRGNGFDMWE